MESKLASGDRQTSLAQRAKSELTEFIAVSAYLYVCFGALILYKTAILRAQGMEFAPFGVAVVKALVTAKFVLTLNALKIGERGKHESSALAAIIEKSLLFSLFVIGLTLVEELTVGYFHGRTSQEVLSDFAGGTLLQAFAVGVILFLILIPYFAFHEIAARLGEGELTKLLTQRLPPKNLQA